MDIESELTETTYSWKTTVSNGLSYRIKVKAACSEKFSENISEETFEIRNEIIPTQITLTPTSITTLSTTTTDGVPGLSGIMAVIILMSFVLLRKERK